MATIFCAVGLSFSAWSQSGLEKKLFETDEVFEITLGGDIRSVLRDRAGTPKKHPATISYLQSENKVKSLAVQLQARGNFRRKRENCTYPPLWIRFTKDSTLAHSIFSEQVKTKLVLPCDNDEYVIREWLVYKLYNLFSPLSFRARLVQVKFDDHTIRKQQGPHYAILLEEEKQMAKRNNMLAVDRKLWPQQTQQEGFLLMCVFEYLIGNTDWSVQYLHNVKLLAKDKNAIATTVPYDFDHAGIVSSPYAKPAEELQLSSVTERRYRGFCIDDLSIFSPVIAKFNELKPDIYSLYNDSKLLDTRYQKFVTKFLDEFYETINNPKDFKREFSYPCDAYGTGNIVIKGLKEN